MWAFVSQSAAAHLNSSVFGDGENICNRLLVFAHGRRSLAPSKLPGMSLSYENVERSNKKAIMWKSDIGHK